MTYNIRFTYRVLSDTMFVYVDNDRITNAEHTIQAQLSDDLTLEIVNLDGTPVFSGVQILNASIVPFWTELLEPLLVPILLEEIVGVFNRLSWKSNETEPENIFERIIGERWTMAATLKDLIIGSD